MKNTKDTFLSGVHLRDVYQLVLFVLAVIAGVLVINSFIFQSFDVSGRSMEATLYDGDHLIVNKIPVTVDNLEGKQYSPQRGQIIVFKNPDIGGATSDQYIVKRVIAFAGERVVVKNGSYTVYNRQNPNGFNPDATDNPKPGSPTFGDVDVVVPDGTLFVGGDHRTIDPATNAPYSLDSRDGLGYIPLDDVIGPVSLRIWPLPAFHVF